MDKKISVIVPIYNVEKYLRRCVDSIINQTYTNLEIILVNDGSTDGCYKICEEYRRKDTRIKVINKKNGGLSDARNAGLDIATGRYIGFIDSDDWIANNMYSEMMEIIMNEDVDIVECGVEYVYNDRNSNIISENCSRCIINRQEGLAQLIKHDIRQTVWNKLYKFEVINGIKFPVGKRNEDEFWTYKVLDNATYIAKISKKLYFYYQREGSIINSSYSIKNLDGLDARYDRLEYLSKYPQIEKIAKKAIIFDTLYHYQKCLKYLNGDNKLIAQRYIKKRYEKIKISYNDFKNYSNNERIWYIMSKVSITQTAKIRNILNIGI